jgi:hypothetical protein
MIQVEMKSDHAKQLLRGAWQEPAVALGNVFRYQANVKRDSFGRCRDGMASARKTMVDSAKFDLRYNGIADRQLRLTDVDRAYGLSTRGAVIGKMQRIDTHQGGAEPPRARFSRF